VLEILGSYWGFQVIRLIRRKNIGGDKQNNPQYKEFEALGL
jgi:hypothetical protein